jgi:hypothetical protein
MSFLPVLECSANIFHVHPVTVRFRGARDHGLGSDFTSLDFLKKIAFGNRTHSLRTAEKAFLHKVPISGHTLLLDQQTTKNTMIANSTEVQCVLLSVLCEHPTIGLVPAIFPEP